MPVLARVDADVAWQASGDGPAVILLNGLSSPSGTWFRLARHLLGRYRVLTMDNRGVGQTRCRGPVTIEAMASDAVAVLDAAGVQQAHVLGMSMGGLIAQELAVTAPERVTSLVLACTHVGLPHAATLGAAGLPGRQVQELVASSAHLGPAERMIALRDAIYHPDTPVALIEQDEAVRDAWPTSAEGYSAQLAGAGGWERLAQLAHLRVPTMVLHGDADLLVPLPQAERLAAAIPGAELRVVAGAGHELFTDREADCAREVARFFGSHDRAVEGVRS